VESNKLTFKMLIGLVPAPRAVKSKTASVPLPLTPAIGPMRVSALKADRTQSVVDGSWKEKGRAAACA
jgi:hypothetical protein